MDIGLLVARAVFGTVMAAHGTQKLFGWFGGYGIAGTGGFFETLGFPTRSAVRDGGRGDRARGRPPARARRLRPDWTGARAERHDRCGSVSVHLPGGLFATTNGIEIPLLYAAAAVALALTGPGQYSLDAVLGVASAWPGELTWGVLVAAIVGAIANLALRRGPVPASAHA